ncbi:hypothetical protein NECAME_01024 [Necator americanus]|uniref:Uncharacterized protein n=1 Tax=Necator americanus TaxID=51031 RepID=W2SMI0_NECAM|nr:hypothetical protein NECAME_01024 [Necator americanus]ETN70076.1 hypothetical protein NECAME_01024 [Necator americanus]
MTIKRRKRGTAMNITAMQLSASRISSADTVVAPESVGHILEISKLFSLVSCWLKPTEVTQQAACMWWNQCEKA